MSKKKPEMFPKTLYVTDETDGDDTFLICNKSIREAANALGLGDEGTDTVAEYELKRVLTIKREIKVVAEGR